MASHTTVTLALQGALVVARQAKQKLSLSEAQLVTPPSGDEYSTFQEVRNDRLGSDTVEKVPATLLWNPGGFK
jgi:hypothetical protein